MIKYVVTLPKIEDLVPLIKDAFASEPWLENLSDQECLSRSSMYLGKKNVRSISAYEDSELIGVILVDELDLMSLENERGKDLKDWAISKNIQKVLWGRETLIRRSFQSQGVGKELRRRMILSIYDESFRVGEGYEFDFLLTRMRDDNLRIIKIAEGFGYERTGVRVKSSTNENIWHEYWFKSFLAK